MHSQQGGACGGAGNGNAGHGNGLRSNLGGGDAAGWLKALQADEKLLVHAAAQAQRAVEDVLGRNAPVPTPELTAGQLIIVTGHFLIVAGHSGPNIHRSGATPLGIAWSNRLVVHGTAGCLANFTDRVDPQAGGFCHGGVVGANQRPDPILERLLNRLAPS